MAFPFLAFEHAFAFNAFLMTTHADMTDEPPWIPLWEDNAPGTSPVSGEIMPSPVHVTRISQPVVQVWMPHAISAEPRPVLCIFPGGGYRVLAIDKEGTKVARWAVEHGMVAVVLKYRVSDDPEDELQFPVPLLEARRAIRYVRRHAGELHIDPARVGVLGFSAGGHLAAMTATLWERSIPLETADDIDEESSRPDFAMLIYPVISIDLPYGLAEHKPGMLPADGVESWLALCSPYRQVNERTPPLFLVHAADDPISCLNSFDMARAASEHGVSVAFHLLPSGGHGFGLGIEGQPSQHWTAWALEWLSGLPAQSK